jgi:hypothetical protein
LEITVEDITRRDFFRICSKDTVKDTVRAWQSFHKDVEKSKQLSCNEAALKLFGKVQKKVSKIQTRKGG